MTIKKNLEKIKSKINNKVTLVAVSKQKSISDIYSAYISGQREFGENKVQELLTKVDSLPDDIKWHMIGHLQRNKVKFIAPFINLIQTVDSIKLLKEINKRAQENNRIINCLLQVNISQEKSKFGLQIGEIKNIILTKNIYKNIKILGLMAMASNTSNSKQITNEFRELCAFFNKIKNSEISVLSMGMSNDYNLAISCGSNMIRLGSAIFGERN